MLREKPDRTSKIIHDSYYVNVREPRLEGMEPVEEGWKILGTEEVNAKRIVTMSHEWSTDWESVSDQEKARMMEEEARFKADPAAGCRGIFYGALFSSFIFFFLTFILVLSWWIR